MTHHKRMSGKTAVEVSRADDGLLFEMSPPVEHVVPVKFGEIETTIVEKVRFVLIKRVANLKAQEYSTYGIFAATESGKMKTNKPLKQINAYDEIDAMHRYGYRVW